MKLRIWKEVLIWNKDRREFKRALKKAQEEDAKEQEVEKEFNPRKMYIHPEFKGQRTYINPFRSSREYSPV
jgi:hypothetical protein